MKKLLILDMWASGSTSTGPSKHWLYNKLAGFYDIEVLSLPRSIMSDLSFMFRSFSPHRARWGAQYYNLKEHANKTPAFFRKHTAMFEKMLRKKKVRYDLLFQIGALCGPVGDPAIPHVSYHDQTVRLVEAGDSDWLPADFPDFRDEWYALEQKVYKSMTMVVTYSAWARESVLKDYAVLPECATVIPTACKLSFPSRDEALLPRKRQMLFVTTDFYRKGGDLLLAAFPLIKARIPDIELIIAGGRPPDSISLSHPAIKYLGTLSPAALRSHYLSAEVLVHPARYDAFPNVVKEALACGLPIVASGVCGISEMLEYGEAGVIMKKNDADEIARAVCDMLSDAALYQKIQERSLKAREQYRIDKVGERFIDLFDRCIADNSGGRTRLSR